MMKQCVFTVFILIHLFVFVMPLIYAHYRKNRNIQLRKMKNNRYLNPYHPKTMKAKMSLTLPVFCVSS